MTGLQGPFDGPLLRPSVRDFGEKCRTPRCFGTRVENWVTWALRVATPGDCSGCMTSVLS